MSIISDLTDDTLKNLTKVILGESKFTTRDIIYMALQSAMADAYRRGQESMDLKKMKE